LLETCTYASVPPGDSGKFNNVVVRTTDTTSELATLEVDKDIVVVTEVCKLELVVLEEVFVDVEFRDPMFTTMGRVVSSAIMLLFASFKFTFVNVIVKGPEKANGIVRLPVV
jgi:hypothetical protein